MLEPGYKAALGWPSISIPIRMSTNTTLLLCNALLGLIKWYVVAWNIVITSKFSLITLRGLNSGFGLLLVTCSHFWGFNQSCTNNLVWICLRWTTLLSCTYSGRFYTHWNKSDRICTNSFTLLQTISQQVVLHFLTSVQVIACTLTQRLNG